MADFLTVMHACKDFPAWKEAYDADAPRRTAAGLTEMHVLCEYDDANLVALMFGVSDVRRAKAFAAAGVTGTPRIRFRQGQYTRVSAASYATMTLTVRDYAASMKAYAMDAADRKAASLSGLSVLQLSEDPNNLLLLWAVADVGRAQTFFDSPALAEHMVKNAGVIDLPERHFWRV